MNSVSSLPHQYISQQISVSITCEEILNFLDLLKTLNDAQELFMDSSVMSNAIRRYLIYWIPLYKGASKEDQSKMSPPLDVHWIWISDMLNPVLYAKTNGTSHSHVSRNILISQMDFTKELWSQIFVEEPFEPSESKVNKNWEMMSEEILLPILRAAERQRTFYYQVSLPHFKDEIFLTLCIERYKKFLHLKTLHPGSFLVPCYGIDLIWHTHQTKPVEYKEDCQALLGQILQHDDSVQDRTPGSKLCQSSELTEKLWREVYDEEFACDGMMYRGLPPNGRLFPMSSQEQELAYKLSYSKKFNFSHLTWTPLNPYTDKYKSANIFLSIRIISTNEETDETLRKTHQLLSGEFQESKFLFSSSQEFIFSPNSSCRFSFILYTNSIFSSSRSISSLFSCYRPSKKILGISEVLSPLLTQNYRDFDLSVFKLKAKSEHLGNIEGSLYSELVQEPQPSSQVLKITSGTFYDAVMPENSESLWGPIPLERLPSSISDNSCKVITHKLLDTEGNSLLSVYLIHSLHLKMSVVQVFSQDKMVSVSHLIGPLTLGNEKALNLQNDFQGLPWRAMIIKDNNGDWGLVAAAWKGMKKGYQIKTQNGKGFSYVPGKPGYFKMTFYNLRTSKKTSIILPRGFTTQNCHEYKFEIPNSVTVDMSKALITLHKDEHEVIQYVNLSFVTCLLYLMVLPRPLDFNAPIKSLIKPLFTEVSRVQMLQICGWSSIASIPSNYTLKYEGALNTQVFSLDDNYRTLEECCKYDLLGSEICEFGGCGGGTSGSAASQNIETFGDFSWTNFNDYSSGGGHDLCSGSTDFGCSEGGGGGGDTGGCGGGCGC